VSPEFIAERIADLAYEKVKRRILDKLEEYKGIREGDSLKINFNLEVGGVVVRTDEGWAPEGDPQ
jgi:hypothetical protein